MDEKEKTKLAFEYARDTTKQLITLASSIIALTVTFLKDIVGKNDSPGRLLIVLTWVTFLVSIFFGLWTLMAITGSIGRDNKKNSISIYSGNITGPATLQVIAFFLGLILTVAFGLAAGMP